MSIKAVIIDAGPGADLIAADVLDEKKWVKTMAKQVRIMLRRHNPRYAHVIIPVREVGFEAASKAKVLLEHLAVPHTLTENDDSLAIARHICQKMARQATTLVCSPKLLWSSLISHNVNFEFLGEGRPMSALELESTIGIPSSAILDLVALIGERSIGMQPIIGANSAIDWLKRFGSIDGIAQNSDSINKGMRRLFQASLPEIQSRRSALEHMVTKPGNTAGIYPIVFDKSKIKYPPLYDFYIKHGYLAWLPDSIRLRLKAGEISALDMTHTNMVDSKFSADLLLKEIGKRNFCSVAIDLAGGRGFSTSFCEGEAWHIPLIGQEGDEFGMSTLKTIMSSKSIGKLVHDAQPIYDWCRKNAIEFNNCSADSSVLAYSISPINAERSLSDLCSEHLSIRLESSSRIGDLPALLGARSDAALRINRHLYRIAAEDGATLSVFKDLDMPLVEILGKMRSTGFLIDTEKLVLASGNLKARAARIVDLLGKIAGEPVNVNAPEQVSSLLFDKLGLSTKGNPNKSTSEKHLAKLEKEHEAPALVNEYRKLSKLISTNTESLLAKVNPATNRVHCNFHQNVTATGRLSCRDPNLQAIPIRSEEGRRIRSAFIASPNHLILKADYSQVELRILAHLSGDEKLVRSFLLNEDPHLQTAQSALGKPKEKLTEEDRRAGKTINFGLIYGISTLGLAGKIGCTEYEAGNYINNFFQAHPEILTYLNKTIEQAKANGFVSTFWGRKIYIPNISSADFSTRKGAERAARNAPMQASAADIIKMAMIKIDHEFSAQRLTSKMLLQVHDELVFDVPEHEIKCVSHIVKEKMEGAAIMRVPLVVEMGAGRNWQDTPTLVLDNENEHDYAP